MNIITQDGIRLLNVSPRLTMINDVIDGTIA